jgi:5-formyltetrahydrofolate cyclo-ligase
MTKAELRKIYHDKRGSFSVEEIGAQSRPIADRFFEKFDLSSVENLHCFISIDKFKEIDTSPIFERVWSDFRSIQTSAPRLDRERNELEHCVYTAETELAENAWGIREPIDGDPIDAVEMDLVIVPLLCFDESGYRVGYGKGFYDRFLAGCRPDCRKVGLSFFPPVEQIDDLNEYDIPLDVCITPEKVHRFKRT